MSHILSLTPEDVSFLIAGAEDVEEVGHGGQKIVFRAKVEGQLCVLKFTLLTDGEPLTDDAPPPEVMVRAEREVQTLQSCKTEHVVKPGPVGLSTRKHGTQHLVCFSEEYIDGGDLKQQLDGRGPFPLEEVKRLGLHMAEAIDALWQQNKVHRDVKPGNIMSRGGKVFVLLDAGLAFDLVGESLSVGAVGTPIYFSPEQFEFHDRRQALDWRSDLFSLGVTMYEMYTGQHPFFNSGIRSAELARRIREGSPQRPSTLIPAGDDKMDALLARMMGKRPHLRYRKLEHFKAALHELEA